MGMFDWVKSSYPLPEPFMGTNQCKDIEDCYGGTLTHYWIDPEGYLWYGDYRDTTTFEAYEEGDPRYDPDKKWMNYEWVPTGEHGKWRVHPLTKYVEIYPDKWEGKWEDWPRLKLHFKSGKLQDFTDITGQ
jgi:hypothetical protein